MFTGLIAGTGRLARIERLAGGVRLEIETPLAAELADGDSVAVGGVCLTAVDAGPNRFASDVMEETLARSALAALDESDRVNLELPLRAGDRLGGHFVQGHVDGTGTVSQTADEGFARRLRIECAPALLRYIVEKGSIAVDGVSLTVAAIDDGGFEVSLIPETLRRTTLGDAGPGRVVNLEVDILAKHLERLAPAEVG